MSAFTAVRRILLGLLFIAGGVSGKLVLRGTNSPLALAAVGALLVGWGIVSVATNRAEAPRHGGSSEPVKRSTWRLVHLVSLATALVAFAGLTAWTRFLPVLRGSAWSLKDTLVRAGAVLSGVIFVVLALGAMLPLLLDRLEGRTFSAFVAARHVRSQKSGFLTVISVLSICGVALSSCALSSVVSVMGGFSHDLKRKILGNNAHIVIDTTAQTPWG